MLFLSLDAIEAKVFDLRRFLRLKLLFLIFLIASNLILLPLYYRSEKQNFRGLVNYLSGHLRESDTIFVQSIAYIPAILHYFGTIPKGRHYTIPYEFKDSGKQIEFKKTFVYENFIYIIYSSNICCAQYISGDNRLWIIHGKEGAKQFSESRPVAMKGYFDGRFASFRKFPTDAPIYLFLLDPSSPDEKGIDLPID